MQVGDFAYIRVSRLDGEVCGGRVAEIYETNDGKKHARIYGIGRGEIGKEVFETYRDAMGVKVWH